MVHNPINTAISFVILIAVVGGSFYYVSATDVKEPYLGIRAAAEVTPGIAEAIGLQEARGLLIYVIDQGSPADQAGLIGGNRIAVIDGREVALGGDVIIAIDGVQIQGADDTEQLLADKVAGDDVMFTVIRGSTSLDVSAVIGER
ncbi:MAG TPA: PDZ domain-containing protein [Nitrososphaera sp.]|nr:PDZ domain-containing protein [Nitrososphaera sp.]